MLILRRRRRKKEKKEIYLFCDLQTSNSENLHTLLKGINLFSDSMKVLKIGLVLNIYQGRW